MNAKDVAQLKRDIRRTLQAVNWRFRTGPPEDAQCLWEHWQRLTARLRATEGRETP